MKLDQFTKKQQLATRRKQSAEPTTESKTIQTPLYIPKNPLLIPSASYNLYRTHCTNKITNPGNSQ